MNQVIKTASEFAIHQHDEVCNQKYGDLPYSEHLRMVYEQGAIYKRHIPQGMEDVVLSACWLHDSIEDARLTYNDITQRFGVSVAEIVYACTNEKGKTRKERASVLYYAGIRVTPGAVFVKMCDRMANVRFSQNNNTRLFLMYQKENDDFLYNLRQEHSRMGNDLKDIFLEL